MPQSSSIKALIALNGALLLVLAAVTFSPVLSAQAGGARGARGDYTMIGGNAAGAESGVLYILDTVNQDMVILAYDRNERQLVGVGYRNLAADAAALLRGGQPTR